MKPKIDLPKKCKQKVPSFAGRHFLRKNVMKDIIFFVQEEEDSCRLVLTNRRYNNIFICLCQHFFKFFSKSFFTVKFLRQRRL